MEYDIYEGEKLLGGTPLYRPPSKDEVDANRLSVVNKADKLLTILAPVATLANPVAGAVLQVAKVKTAEFLAEKKDEALNKSISEIKADTAKNTKSISEINADSAKITKAVSEVKMDSEAIKQEIQDIRDKPISKQTIKNDTTFIVVNAIEFITTKDDSNNDFVERQQNFSRIQNSFSELYRVAMLNDFNKLAQVLDVSNHLVGIAKSFETLQMASTLGTLSMESFASGLGMVTSVFTLCQSIFGKKDNGIGLASMIIQGFQHVIQSIHALQERMEYRFDRIEHLMERQHYQTITMLFELSRQTNGLHNLIMHGQEIQTKQVHSIRYDIKQVSSNLLSCSAMIQNNINAFREEKLIDILTEIHYFISTDNITIDQIHQYFAKLMACFKTVAINPNLTGNALLSSSTDIRIKALQDALATNLYSVVNIFTGPTKVGHLEILTVLDTYTRQLIRIIPTPTEYHREFSARITAEIDKIKTVTFSNPFSTTDADVLVTENWTHKKSEMHSKVNEWFSNEVAIVLEKIRNETANDFCDDNYISIKLKKHYSSSAINCSDEARSLDTLKTLKAAGLPWTCAIDLADLVNPSSSPRGHPKGITLHEAYRLCVAFDNNDVASKDFYSWESFEYVKKFLDNKYKSNEHMFIDLEFNGYSLEHIRDVSQIDMLLVQYGIYEQFEFTHRYQQYQDMGIIIKLKFCIGFDETIQITEYLVNVISEKKEISRRHVIQQKYAELEDLKRFKPIEVLKDAIFGYICTGFILVKISIKRIDDFLVRGDMFTFRSKMFASRYSRSLVAQGIPTKVEEFKAETAEFFKLHDDNYKEAVRQNELHTIAEQVLVKLKAKQNE